MLAILIYIEIDFKIGAFWIIDINSILIFLLVCLLLLMLILGRDILLRSILGECIDIKNTKSVAYRYVTCLRLWRDCAVKYNVAFKFSRAVYYCKIIDCVEIIISNGSMESDNEASVGKTASISWLRLEF